MQPYNIFRETLQCTKHSFTFNSYSDLSKPDTIRFVMVDNSLGYSRILMDRILPIVFKASATFSINQELGVIQSEVKNHKTSILDLDGRITKNTNSISTIKQRADSIESTVSSHTDTINNITGTITHVQDDISSIKQTAKNIESRVTSNEQTIDDITGNVKTNTEKISSINQRADSIESSVKSMEKRIDNISGNTQITEDMSSLKQRADSIEATVKSHTETISDLDGRVTTNTDNISKIKQTADSISSTVESLGDTYVSKSELTQKSDEILAQVNNTYIKIGDDNITIGGNTTVKGNLTLTQSDQGFKLVGNTGVTEIMPKSIGTYKEFQSQNTGTEYVTKTTNSIGAQVTPGNSDIVTFAGSCIIHLGDRKKGDYVSVKFGELSGKITNAYDSSQHNWTNNYVISTSWSAKVMNQYNSVTLADWGKLESMTKYSITFDADTPDARVYLSFTGNTTYSSWKGSYGPGSSGQLKPMPQPVCAFFVSATLTLPTAAHMLIGYDGWAVNFGNNKTVYCGSDGFIASFGDQLFKITSNGITGNNRRTAAILSSANYNANKIVYYATTDVDTIIALANEVHITFPSNPYDGYELKIFDKTPKDGTCYITTTPYKLVMCKEHKNSGQIYREFELEGYCVRTYTFFDGQWYEGYEGY